jgi:DNA-binding NarL/FixJ family response regulator
MRLLLCDSQRLLVHALAEALRERGHAVVVCEDAEVLPALLARLRPDVCVVEATYAGELRLDAVLVAHADRGATALLLLTGEMDARVWRAYDTGAVDGVVSKRASLSAVETALRRAHGGHREVTGFRRGTAPTVPPQRAPLTMREHEVLDLLVAGLPTGSIADDLAVSRNTVRTHVANILHKLDVPDRAKAVHHAVDMGLVDPHQGGGDRAERG